MKSKYILALLLFFVLVLSTYYLNNDVLDVLNAKQDSLSVNSKLDFNVKEIKESGNNYEIKGYIPYTNYKKVNEEINRQVNLYIDEFKKNVEGLTPPVEGQKFLLEFIFNSYEYDKFISIIMNTYIDTGGAHPNTYIYTFIYDTKADSIIKINELIKMGNDVLNKLSTYTYNKLKDDYRIKEANQEQMLVDGTKPLKENFSRFAFTKEGLLVLFPKYQVAPYSYGEFTVTIPYSEIGINI